MAEKKYKNIIEKIKVFFLASCLFYTVLFARIYAFEKRSIYIGDLIELKIQAGELNLDELKDKFGDFEIVGVKNISDGYIITLRTFEPKERVTNLKGKEIVIDIKSTLDEIARDEVFESGDRVLGSRFYVKWKYILYILVIVFLFALAFNLYMFFKKRNKKPKSPYQLFLTELGAASSDGGKNFVLLTACLKSYIEREFLLLIRGKTTEEILNEVQGVPGLRQSIPKIQKWLQKSDHYKFSGVNVSIDEKQSMSKDLEELVGQIEKTKQTGEEEDV